VTRVFNELSDILAGKLEGKDLEVNPLEVDVSIFPEPNPVEDLYVGSARSALLMGLMNFSEAAPAKKDDLISAATPMTSEDLDSTSEVKYSGWPAMNMIVRQGLAMKEGRYYKKSKTEAYTFSLTDLGWRWAKKVQGEYRQRLGGMPRQQTPPKKVASEASSSQKRQRPHYLEPPDFAVKCQQADFPASAIPLGSKVSVRAWRRLSSTTVRSEKSWRGTLTSTGTRSNCPPEETSCRFGLRM